MISPDEYRTRLETLKNIIKELSKESAISGNDDIECFVGRLQTLYTYTNEECDFRHEYSAIFGAMVECQDNGNNLNSLGQNIETIYHYLVSQKKYDKESLFRESVHKLYDHINLELSRMNYIEVRQSTLQDQIGNSNYQVEKVSHTLMHLEEKTTKIKNDYKNVQKETITILSLFSAVVLAFMGGIGFSSSVLESMNSSSIYKVVFICGVLGFVLINLVYLLLRFILHVNQFSDLGTSKFTKVIKWINIGLIILMIVDTIAWFIDFHLLADKLQALYR